MDDFFTLSDDFKIWLSFSLFRDWREVEADDANGVRRRGIFIPYLQNGIHITALHPWQKPHTHNGLAPVAEAGAGAYACCA